MATANILVVGGGGGGAAGWNAGGGGGGGVRNSPTFNLTAGTYTVTIGTGGNGGAAGGQNPGIIGGTTTFQGIAATAGGGGGCAGSSYYGGNGACGGGGGASMGIPATGGDGGTGSVGYAGGSGCSNGWYTCGGGGGMGSVGANATTTSGGAGGDGVSYNITGSAVIYGSGGGAAGCGDGTHTVAGAVGGNGLTINKGGNSQPTGWTAGSTPTAPNYGCGGGGGGSGGNLQAGGSGSQGVVIISVPTGTANLSHTGTMTNAVVSTNTVYTITTSGTLTVVVLPTVSGVTPSNSYCTANGTYSTLSATATTTNGGGTLTYKWQINQSTSGPSGTTISTAASMPATTYATLIADGGIVGTNYLWLTVTNSTGSASAVSTAITLISAPTCASTGPYSVYIGQTVAFACPYAIPSSPATISSYAWKIGSNVITGGNVQNPTGITYANLITAGAVVGSNTLTLAVTDSYGTVGTATTTITLSVSNVLIVAGGGAGGTFSGGGGGGVINNSSMNLSGTYSITIGTGGTGRAINGPAGYGTFDGPNGGNTSFTGMTTAIGGGGGTPQAIGKSGGCGGGGGAGGYAGGTPSQGYSGGTGGSGVGGGGGGMGAIGGTGSGTVGGSGGTGVSYSITGTAVIYGAGGGGASATSTMPNNGGISSNGGGNSIASANSMTAGGTPSNYGCGGGGGGYWGASTYPGPCGSGSQGCAIISIPTSASLGVSHTAGFASSGAVGVNTCYVITSSGTLTVTSPTIVAPTITSINPSNSGKVGVNGTYMQLSATATTTAGGSNTPTYNWQINNTTSYPSGPSLGTAATLPNTTYTTLRSNGATVGTNNYLWLTITNSAGSVYAYTQITLLTIPTGSIGSGAYYATYPNSISLSCTTTTDLNATIVSYTWQLNGTAMTGVTTQNPTISYNDLMTYGARPGYQDQIGLFVTDNSGQTSSTTYAALYLTPISPTITSITPSNSGICTATGTNTTLSATTITGNCGSTLTYSWQINNSTSGPTGTIISTAAPMPATAYATLVTNAGGTGIKYLWLTVTNSAGSSSSYVPVTLVTAPTCATTGPYSVCSETTAVFTCPYAIPDVNATISSYAWKIGSTLITGGDIQNPTITYNNLITAGAVIGSNTLNLVVTDNYGGTGTATTTITLFTPAILVVGGGGSGAGATGASAGGGGGGGGVYYSATQVITLGSYNISIGAGGIGTLFSGSPGGNTDTGGLIPVVVGGGGRGGWAGVGMFGYAYGGSGGGSGAIGSLGGAGSSPGGNGGGQTSGTRCGGGGAYGATGTDGASGGQGATSTGTAIAAAITGSIVYYGSGGGGGNGTATGGGAGGTGGGTGGNGGASWTNGTNATTGTALTSYYGGGGGGGGGNTSSYRGTGGKGAPGVVIIKYNSSLLTMSGIGSSTGTGASSYWWITANDGIAGTGTLTVAAASTTIPTITSITPSNSGICLSTGTLSATASTTNATTYIWQINNTASYPSGTVISTAASMSATAYATLLSYANGSGNKYLWLTVTNSAGSVWSYTPVTLVAAPTVTINGPYSVYGPAPGTFNCNVVLGSSATISSYTWRIGTTTILGGPYSQNPTITWNKLIQAGVLGTNNLNVIVVDNYGQTTTSSNATLTLSCPYLLIVGGGGGGGGGYSSVAGGGGGGGGVVYTTQPLSGNYDITIGTAGTGGIASNRGNQGGQTSIAGTFSVTVGGGGGGGAQSYAATVGTGSVGQGGGGGGAASGTGAAGVSPGMSGGNRGTGSWSGGGGGYNTAGNSGDSNGTGATSSGTAITSWAAVVGSTKYYGSGGGGGANVNTSTSYGGDSGLAGGNGGSGGSVANNGRSAPLYGCGGGGGGCYTGATSTTGGNGKDGIILIRYNDTYIYFGGTTGIKSGSGATSLWTITSSGQITVNSTVPTVTTTGPYYITSQTTINIGCTTTAYNAIVSYAWVMNGVTLSTAQNFTASYSDFINTGAVPGDNTLTLTVIDSIGQIASIDINVNVTGVYAQFPGPADINIGGTIKINFATNYVTRGGAIIGINAGVIINWCSSYTVIGNIIIGFTATASYAEAPIIIPPTIPPSSIPIPEGTETSQIIAYVERNGLVDYWYYKKLG